MGLVDLLRLLRPEEVAERIASGKLDMRPEAVAERREALFPETFYSGSTSPDILENPPTIMGPQYLWASESPGLSASYSGKRIGRRPDEAPTIYPLAVNTEGFDRVLGGGARWNTLRNPTILRGSERISMEDIDTNTEELLDFAYESGIPGVLFQDVIDPGPYQKLMNLGVPSASGGRASQREIDEFLQELERNPPLNMAVPDTTRVRAKYGAAFDPDYTGPNILGGAAGTAALAGLLAAPQEAEAGTKSKAASEFITGVMGLIDPRYDNRAGSRDRLAQLTPGFESRGTVDDVPRISLASLEGRDFITSMSDRTRGGGLLQAINDVDLAYPINLQGGQDFMMENPGMAWASAHTPVHQIMRAAAGENALYLPFRMAPSGGDFAKMTGEAMLSYASANMTPSAKKEFNKAIQEYVTKGKMVKDKKTGESRLKGDGLSIKGWKGVDDPSSIEAWRNTPDSVRKELMDMMDKRFRNSGGLTIGEARLAVSDPSQVGARDAGIQNVGEVFGGGDIIVKSGHPSYPYAVPGQGLGRLDDQPMSIFDLLPDARLGKEQRRVGDTVDPLNPAARDIRALQMKPYKGRIDEATLRRLEDRGVNVNSPAAVDAALMQIYAEDAHNMQVDEGLRSIGLNKDPMYDYGTLLPVKKNIVTGESSLAFPEFARDIVRGLIDIGTTRKSGVYNPTALLDIAL